MKKLALVPLRAVFPGPFFIEDALLRSGTWLHGSRPIFQGAWPLIFPHDCFCCSKHRVDRSLCIASETNTFENGLRNRCRAQWQAQARMKLSVAQNECTKFVFYMGIHTLIFVDHKCGPSRSRTQIRTRGTHGPRACLQVAETRRGLCRATWYSPRFHDKESNCSG